MFHNYSFNVVVNSLLPALGSCKAKQYLHIKSDESQPEQP